MAGLLEKVEKSKLDRRTFVAAAAITGVAATLGLTGCDNKVATTDTVDGSPTTEALSGGEWKPFICTQGSCTMRCVNMAYVVDGVIMRVKTDDFSDDTTDYPQQRSCLKGHTYRHYVTSADRLKYPMKRKSWQPGGGANINADKRGVDEWERITWEEAIDYIASELTRIRDTYGNRAFLGLGQSNAGGMCGSPILNLLGGCLTTFGQQSQGGFPVVCNQTRGYWFNGVDSQDRFSLRHSKLIVLFGYNSAWNASGNMIHFIHAKQAGAKVIMIDPWLNPSAQAIVDEWIPVRPSTDGALLEALAYEIIQNNWQDQDFLDRCCVGFDAEHMPADAATNENFKDYILGAYDNLPKTPEWASKICGVSPDIIRNLAEQIGTTKPMAFKSSCAPARSHYGNRYAQLFLTVGWMTGSYGILGAETACGVQQLGAINAKNIISCGPAGYKNPPNPICTETRTSGQLTGGKFTEGQEYGFAYSEMMRAVATGEYTLPGPEKGKKGTCDIKCIVNETSTCPTNAETGAKWVEEAYRKVEFVYVQDLFLVTDARYADIVLPAQTTLEKDFNTSDFCNAPDSFLAANKVIEPYYEAKDDLEIFFMLRDKLGFGDDVAPAAQTRQLNFNALSTTTIAEESGERVPFFTVTQADLDKYEVEGTVQEGKITLDEFFKTGIYYFPRKDGDAYMNIYGKAFRDDPEANPAKTTSGKFEIYCQSLKNHYDNALLHDIDALPKYKPALDGYEQSLEDPTYPFQLITPHQARQIHGMQQNVKMLTEVFPNDLVMNEGDARGLGLGKGDFVLITSAEGGQIARRLNPIPNLMPGVVLLGQGCWQVIDQESGIDIGGNPNTISRPTLLGDGYQAYNTLLVKIEEYTGAAIEVDYKRAPFIPLAE